MELAKKIKITKRIRELQSQVAERAVENATKLVDIEIASKQERCRVYGDIYGRILQVLKERGADPSMADVPGGKTGLLIRRYKSLGSQLMPEYAIDTAALAELRATAQQAAEELGQWKSDADATAADRRAAS